ncbi:DUF402 domain-containing protein [Alicyclobacillus sp. SO9]|uniref:DUF402 domain-containing protein n=1 Tax=Alicyclobacillus sp. SO9 TaxID=2665646 RepID=UPI0018E6F578|nr:DUF402 domain-containing protein [Alicyclobacillus sp. SO9]
MYPTDSPWAFWIPAFSPVVEAAGETWSSSYPVMALFWPQRYYQVFLLLKEEGTEYYCNVITPPVYNARTRTVEFRDLDLDVVMMGGKLWVADEDEFYSRSPSYPRTWIKAAEDAKQQLLQGAAGRQGPFSVQTAQRWRTWIGARNSRIW